MIIISNAVKYEPKKQTHVHAAQTNLKLSSESFSSSSLTSEHSNNTKKVTSTGKRIDVLKAADGDIIFGCNYRDTSAKSNIKQCIDEITRPDLISSKKLSLSMDSLLSMSKNNVDFLLHEKSKTQKLKTNSRERTLKIEENQSKNTAGHSMSFTDTIENDLNTKSVLVDGLKRNLFENNINTHSNLETKSKYSL